MRSPLTVTALLAGAIIAAGPAAAAPQSCADLGGVVQSGAICQVQASQSAYVMDITFPLDYPDEQAILDYLSQTRDGFVNVASTPDARNHPYEMDVVAESLSSSCSRTSAARTPRPGTRRSPTTRCAVCPSPSTPSSRPAPIR